MKFQNLIIGGGLCGYLEFAISVFGFEGMFAFLNNSHMTLSTFKCNYSGIFS